MHLQDKSRSCPPNQIAAPKSPQERDSGASITLHLDNSKLKIQLVAINFQRQRFPFFPTSTQIQYQDKQISSPLLGIFLGRSHYLYSFSVAAVSNYHKLSSLKHPKFIILQFWRAEIQNRFH